MPPRTQSTALKLGMVLHNFNPNTWEAGTGKSLGLKTSLVIKVSSRIARATHGNPVLEGGSYKTKVSWDSIQGTLAATFSWKWGLIPHQVLWRQPSLTNILLNC